MKPLHPISDAPGLLGISRQRLGKLIQALDVPRVKLGSRTYLSAYQIDRIRREIRERDIKTVDIRP